MTTRKKLNRFNRFSDEMLQEIGNAVAQVCPSPGRTAPSYSSLLKPEHYNGKSLLVANLCIQTLPKELSELTYEKQGGPVEKSYATCQ